MLDDMIFVIIEQRNGYDIFEFFMHIVNYEIISYIRNINKALFSYNTINEAFIKR